MARSPINDALTRLSAIRDDAKSAEARKLLRQAFEKGQGLVAAKAAAIVAGVACGAEPGDGFDPAYRDEIVDEAWTAGFLPLLAQAFSRLCDNPERDKGAHGKIAVIKALNRMDYGNAELFLRGVKCCQMEFELDKAAPVRMEALFGLVRLRYPDRLRLITDALWDNAQDARVGAVRAAVYDGSEAAEMILRAKAWGGDRGDDIPAKPPDGGIMVYGEIFNSLLLLGRERNIPFVLRFTSDQCVTDGVREQAALALGACRLPDALAALAGKWPLSVTIEERERIVYAVTLNGTDDAMALLAGWVKDAERKTATRYRIVMESVWGEGSPRLRSVFPGS